MGWEHFYSPDIKRDWHSPLYDSVVEMPREVIRKAAGIFDVGYSYLIDNVLPVEPEYDIQKSEKKTESPDIRISIPENNIEKFKQVFLYILSKVGAKPNVGQTVLYKLLYFIDFDYYELYEKQLMGLSYIAKRFKRQIIWKKIVLVIIPSSPF